MVGDRRFQPVDLSVLQGCNRCGGIAECQPFDALEMSYFGAGGKALAPLGAGHIPGEPLVARALSGHKLGSQEAVRPAAHHFRHLLERIGVGKALRHDARHGVHLPGERQRQMRKRLAETELDRAVVRCG